MERKIVSAIILIITSIVPLIITPWSKDYYYHPKITLIYILCLIMAVLYLTVLKRYKIKKETEDYLLGIYIVIILISTIFAVNRLQALLGRPLREEGFAALLCYGVIYFIVSKYYTFNKKHLIFLLLSASIIASYGIIQYFGYNIITPDVYRANLSNQSYSTLGNRNFVGSYLVLALPLSIIGYLYTKKLFYLIVAMILYTCLLCTLTRGAWLGFLCSMLFILWYVIKNKLYIRRLVLISILFFVITIGFNSISNGAIFGRFVSLGKDITAIANNNADSAGSNRMFIWKRAIKLIPERPIFGSGPDNFGIVFMNRFQNEVYKDWTYIYVDKAHNEYLQIATATGVPSLIIYLSFIFVILRKGIKKSKDNIYIIALLGSIIGYLTQAFFNISVVSVAPIFWVMLGAIGNFLKGTIKIE